MRPRPRRPGRSAGRRFAIPAPGGSACASWRSSRPPTTYFGVRALTQGSVTDAIANAASVDRLERLAGIAWEPDLQAAILDHDTLVRVANWATSSGTGPCSDA